MNATPEIVELTKLIVACPQCGLAHDVKDVVLHGTEDQRETICTCPTTHADFLLSMAPVHSVLNTPDLEERIHVESRREWLQERQRHLLEAVKRYHDAGDFGHEALPEIFEELACNCAEIAI